MIFKACPVGRFGINCVSECHCENGDYCDQASGFCGNGRCDVHWTGNNCQGNGFLCVFPPIMLSMPF